MYASRNLECVQRTFLQNCLPLMLIEKVKLRLKVLKGTKRDELISKEEPNLRVLTPMTPQMNAKDTDHG